MYQPKRAPKYRLYHRNWRTGYLQNSARGDAEAKRQGKPWVDNDWHLSSDGGWVNGHGAPEKVWGVKRFESQTWAVLKRKQIKRGKFYYHLRNAPEAFADAKQYGRKVEAEIKDVRPLAAQLPTALARMKRHAIATWGDGWADHVTVKAVSTIGGPGYALDVMGAAHDLGFNTLLTVRGRDRFRRYEGHTEITWVRNSLVIR